VSIYADDDPQPVLPTDDSPSEEDGRWRPGDETLSPFDWDDEEEMQA
jgi:hypothetical protein